MSGLTLVAIVAFLASPPAAEAGPPAYLAQARYVALGYELGTGFVAENPMPAEVLPEERQALDRIRTEIEKWGRHVIVVRPAHAELLIAIRKGRLASIGVASRGGDPTGGPPGGRPIGTGSGTGAQLSTPDDTIHVYDGRGGGILWRGTKPNGLASASGASAPLWQAFRAEVEKQDRLAQKR